MDVTKKSIVHITISSTKILLKSTPNNLQATHSHSVGNPHEILTMVVVVSPTWLAETHSLLSGSAPYINYADAVQCSHYIQQYWHVTL